MAYKADCLDYTQIRESYLLTEPTRAPSLLRQPGYTTLKRRHCHRTQPKPFGSSSLLLTTVDDGGLDGRTDSTGGGAEGLDLLDDLHRLGVGDLTEDNVLPVEPRGNDGGDEELGSVAERL